MSDSTLQEFMEKLEILCKQYGMKPELYYDELTFVPMTPQDEQGKIEGYVGRGVITSVYWLPKVERKRDEESK